MKSTKTVSNRRRFAMVAIGLLTVFVAACQMPSAEPQSPSNTRLSIVGAPDREVEFDLIISGPGMQTITERVSSSDVGTEFGPFEVPSRADVTFDLKARGDIYTGRVTQRFGPGAEEAIDIPVHPGPVFVDREDPDGEDPDSGGRLYQVRDLQVDLSDDESGLWRTITADDIALAIDDAVDDIVDAEYDRDGYLWVLTESGELFAFDAFDDPLEPVASGAVDPGPTFEALAVSEYYVYMLAGGEEIHYRPRTLEEIGVGDYEQLFEAGAFVGTVEGATDDVVEQFADDRPGLPGAPIQSIATGDDGTLYVQYATWPVQISEALEERFDDEIRDLISERFLNRLIGSLLEDLFDSDAAAEMDADFVLTLQAFAAIDFEGMISVLREIAELEATFDEDRDDPEAAEQALFDLIVTLAAYWQPYVDFLVEHTDFDEDDLFGEPENGNGVNGEIETEFDEDFGFAEFIAFFFAMAYLEAGEEGREEFEAMLLFWDAFADEERDPDRLADVFLSDALIGEQVVPAILDELEMILAGVGEIPQVAVNFDPYPLLLVVGIAPDSGNIVSGPTVLGPAETAPAGDLLFADGNLFAAQSSIETEVIGALSLYQNGILEEEEEVEGVLTLLASAIEFHVRQALDDEAEGGEGFSLSLFDPALLDAVITQERIYDMLLDAAGGLPDDALRTMRFIRTGAVVRLSPNLRARGEYGEVDQTGTGRGVFRGPRLFVATRDNRFGIIDRHSDAEPGRLVAFQFGTRTGWRISDPGFDFVPIGDLPFGE